MYFGVHDFVKIVVLFAGIDCWFMYGEFEECLVRLVYVLHDVGLCFGDDVVLFAMNDLKVFEVYWVCLCLGFYLIVVNIYFLVDEVVYVVDDCDVTVLVVLVDFVDFGCEVVARCLCVVLWFVWDGFVDGLDGFGDYDVVLVVALSQSFVDQLRGVDMFYSLGMMGWLKGVWVLLLDC